MPIVYRLVFSTIFLLLLTVIMSKAVPSNGFNLLFFQQEKPVGGGIVDSTKSLMDSTKSDSLVADTMISKSALESEVNYKAEDSIVYDLVNKKVYLFGKAEITFEKMKLDAGHVIIDWTTNTITAEGVKDSAGKETDNPVFLDGDQKYRSKRMVYNFKTKKGKLYELITSEGEGTIHGEEVKKDERDVIFASHAKYTTCDLDHPHYYISARRVKIIPGDKIITGPAYMVIEDVPLPLVLPFGFFPNNKRQASGIIVPGYGESPGRGFFLENGGYYFGFNDHLDLRLTGNLYTKGSWLIDAISRYATRYKFKGNLEFKYGVNKFGDPESTDFEKDRDLILNWTHNQDPKANPNSNFSADVNIASQNAFRNNSRQLQSQTQNSLSSSITYHNSLPRTPFTFDVSGRHSQTLSNHRISITLPSANLSMSRIKPFKKSKLGIVENIGVNYRMDFKNEVNTIDSLLFKDNIWDKMKYGIKHSSTIQTNAKLFKYFTLNPSINYNGYTYFDRYKRIYQPRTKIIVKPNGEDSLVHYDTTILDRKYGLFTAHEYSFNTNLSTRLYGFFGINKFGIVAIRHVLTPNIGFSYRPDFSKSKYGYYDEVQVDTSGEIRKYSLYAENAYGGPSSGEQGNINFSLNNNLEMKVKQETDSGSTTKKIKLFESLNASGAYNMLADSFKLSNINFSARTTLLNNFNIQVGATLDPYVYSSGKRKDEFEVTNSGKLGRINRANFSLNFSLNPELFKPKKDRRKARTYRYVGTPDYMYYTDFDVPWNLSIQYSLDYNKNLSDPSIDPSVVQTISVGGSVSITEKWKFGGDMYYDMETEKISAARININRDLHCWEMSFNWNPVGTRSFYYFQINIKAQVLKDLQLKKKQDPWDR